MQSCDSGSSQTKGRMKVTIKKGSQQNVKAPTMTPSVLVAFVFPEPSLREAVDDTQCRMAAKRDPLQQEKLF